MQIMKTIIIYMTKKLFEEQIPLKIPLKKGLIIIQRKAIKLWINLRDGT